MGSSEVIPCGIHYDCDYKVYWTVDRNGRFLEPISEDVIGEVFAVAWRLKKAVAEHLAESEANTSGYSPSYGELAEAFNNSERIKPWNLKPR